VNTTQANGRIDRRALENLVGGLERPDGVSAEVLSVTTAATGGQVLGVAVWSRAERTCPGCGQGERPADRDCPVTLNPPMGEVQVWSQQHGCGAWWGPVAWEVVPVAPYDDTADDVAQRVTAAVLKVSEASAAEAERLADAVRDRLRADLARWLTLDDDDREFSSLAGDELHPGIYDDAGTWVAWDWDPRDPDGGEVIAVTADDLTTS
jgi:hypothetical protein